MFSERVMVFSMYSDWAVLRRVKWKQEELQSMWYGGWIGRNRDTWGKKKAAAQSPEQVILKLDIYRVFWRTKYWVLNMFYDLGSNLINMCGSKAIALKNNFVHTELCHFC